MRSILRWKRQIESTLQNRAGVPARFRKRTGHDLIRPRCARPPSPKGKAVATKSACDGNGRLAYCRGHDLIRPRCARPPSPKEKAVAMKSACVGNGRLSQPCRIAPVYPPGSESVQGTTSSGLAALGHLPQGGRLWRRSLSAMETAGSRSPQSSNAPRLAHLPRPTETIHPPVRPHPPRCGRTFFHLLHQIFLDSHPLPSL